MSSLFIFIEYINFLLSYMQRNMYVSIFQIYSNFSKFSIQNKFVKLSGQTLRNLEIFKNQVCTCKLTDASKT